MITSRAILEISHEAYKKGIISSNENRFLSQFSNRIAVKDLIPNFEVRKTQSILLKIFRSDEIEEFKSSLHKSISEEFFDYMTNSDFSNREAIIQDEVKTGLIGTVVDEVADVNITNQDFDSIAFFQVKKVSGNVNIILNSEHLLYSKLEDIKKKSPQGYDLILSMITSWGIIEKDVYNDDNAQFFKDLRADWGRELRDRLRNYD